MISPSFVIPSFPFPHSVVTSKYSGNAVRTTHLTGASTDMGIALGHILKGRQEEWWKVQMHGIAVVGFFIGGVLGFFAFEVWSEQCQAGGTCYDKVQLALTDYFPSHLFLIQKFEHAALLVNVCLTTCCAVIHVLYVAYHERMPVISVLESRSEYVLFLLVAAFCREVSKALAGFFRSLISNLVIANYLVFLVLPPSSL